MDILGLFICFAGFIIGLGAVTVIDTLGFLGQSSSYWTLTTIRTHKVTKPLIWIGTSLAIIGGVLYYADKPFVGIPVIHMVLAVILVLNGVFLSFYVSPLLLVREVEGKSEELLPKRLQHKIIISFLISFTGWWSAVYLLVLYILRYGL